MFRIKRSPVQRRGWATVPSPAPYVPTLLQRLGLLELRVVSWWARHGVTLLRLSLGVVFFWFGVLKYFPGVSAAQDLATRTISVLTFGLMPPAVSLPILATWECAIGLGLLLSGHFLKVALLLLLAQMVGTFLPLVFFPHETFKLFPFVPNLEGQYIIKNLVLVSAALVVGATSRGGRLIHDAGAAQTAEHAQDNKARLWRHFRREG